MPPFRNTMRLVHRIERYLHPFQELDVILLCQRLRSDIEQFGASLQNIGLHLVDGSFVKA